MMGFGAGKTVKRCVVGGGHLSKVAVGAPRYARKGYTHSGVFCKRIWYRGLGALMLTVRWSTSHASRYY